MNELVDILDGTSPLVLHILRAGAIVAVMPTLAVGGARMPRLVLSICLGGVLWSLAGMPMAESLEPRQLVGIAANEVLIGLGTGFAVRLAYSSLQLAGELVGHEMGFSMARVMDPSSGVAHTSMSRLLEVVGALTILQFDLHHELVRTLVAANEVAPVGTSVDFGALLTRLLALGVHVISSSVLLVAPVLAVLWLVAISMAVLARAVPQINLLEFGFGLRVLLALGAMTVFLPSVGTEIVELVRECLSHIRELWRPV